MSARMRRRLFLKATAAGALLGGVGVSGSGSALAATAEIEPLAFDSTASQLNAKREPLTDDSLVAVWASETAINVDDWYRLFDGYDADTTYKGPRAGPGVPGESENGPGKGHGD